MTLAGTWHEVALGGLALVYAYIVLLLLIGLPIAVARDMRRRGRTGWSYGVLTVIALPIGLLAWLIDRRRFPVVE